MFILDLITTRVHIIIVHIRRANTSCTLGMGIPSWSGLNIALLQRAAILARKRHVSDDWSKLWPVHSYHYGIVHGSMNGGFQKANV